MATEPVADPPMGPEYRSGFVVWLGFLVRFYLRELGRDGLGPADETLVACVLADLLLLVDAPLPSELTTLLGDA